MVSVNSDLPENNKNNDRGNKLPDYEYLYRSLANHPDPEIREIIELLEQGKPIPKLKPSLLQKIVFIFCSNPKNYHGTAIVTDDVKTGALLTATAVSVSNITDFISNFPVVLFAFKSMGTLPAALIALGINYGFLRYGNCSAEAVSRRHEKSKSWSVKALFALILLNILQSGASIVGAELFNNQPELKQILAEQTIEKEFNKYKDSIASRDPNTTLINSVDYQKYVKECHEGKTDLAKYAAKDPRRNTVYLNLYGEYKDKDLDYTKVPYENLPVCRKISRLEMEAKASYQQLKFDFEAKEQSRLEIADDLLFLEQYFSNIYGIEFTKDGEIASGVTAVRLASQNIVYKAKNLDFAGLGISLYFFSFSVITSAFSVWKTYAFAKRQDVADSFDRKIELKRDLWFEQMFRDAVDDEESQ